MSSAGKRFRPLTRNRMGWVSERLSRLSQEFVAYCATGACQEAPALDIGAGFGVAALAAVKAGASVIANDLEPAHQAEIERRAQEGCTELERVRLQVIGGRFPEELQFEPESLGAVHLSNVLHFLSGKQLEPGIQAVARWLRPGGKLFVQAATPYQSPFAAFLPEYERRLAAQEPWPGWLPKIGLYAKHRQMGQMPKAMHLLDDQVLRRVAVAAGLAVEQATLTRREDLPHGLWLDGRETVVLVAVKPPTPSINTDRR
ncbi:MAG: class I SAM-dependent methyltransferase [Acidobacteria bacterium]|nr:class I SAM-dependent methyltransferase [Acidobacteriota bacterium]